MATATGVTAGCRALLIQTTATFLFTVTLTDDNGDVIDITGSAPELLIWEKACPTNELVHLEVGSGVLVDGPNGKFTLTITAAETALLASEPFPGVYVIRIAYADTTVDVLLTGDALLSLAGVC